MSDLLFSNSYFCIALTLIVFAFANTLQQKFKSPLLNPIVISALVIIGFLSAMGVSNAVYQDGCKLLNYLLTPATICLAFSFYEQFRAMRAHMGAIMVGTLAGAVCCLGTIYLLCRFFGFDRVLTLSLLPKGITNAIGVVLSQEIGGIAAITSTGIAVTGTFCNICAPILCKWMDIHHPIAQGTACGTSGHVIGTARAAELSALAGATGSLALTVAGLFTALLLSVTAQFL